MESSSSRMTATEDSFPEESSSSKFKSSPPLQDAQTRIYQNLLQQNDSICISQFNGLLESSSSCGYCKDENVASSTEQPRKKYTISQFIHHCPPHVYDALLNKNWRRCGDYYYFPKNDSTCCPQYAIRLEVDKFKENRKQRQCRKKLAKYLLELDNQQSSDVANANGGHSDGLRETKRRKVNPSPQQSHDSSSISKAGHADSSQQLYDQKIETLLEQLRSLMRAALQGWLQQLSPSLNEALSKQVPQSEPSLTEWIPATVHVSKRKNIDMASDAMIKFFGMAKKYKLPLSEENFKSPGQLADSIVQHMTKELCEKHCPTVTKVESTKNGFINFTLQDVPKKPSSHGKPKAKKQKPSLTEKEIHDAIHNGLEVKLSRATYKEEEFELYKKYQMTIHHDKESKLTPAGYTRFLIESTLVPISDDRLPFGGYGTFHMQYRIKKTNKLIGVSVIDILPTGWSSVYFFYDTDYSFLSPGVFSALYEIGMLQEEQKKKDIPRFKYLYLGYYIHSCKKMRYKGDYEPSELLCPETHTWVSLQDAREVLDKQKYGRFQKDKSIPRYDHKDPSTSTVADLTLFLNRSLIPAFILENNKEFMGTDEGKEVMEELHMFKETCGDVAAEINVFLTSLIQK